jgi:hypothetical protein
MSGRAIPVLQDLTAVKFMQWNIIMDTVITQTHTLPLSLKCTIGEKKGVKKRKL